MRFLTRSLFALFLTALSLSALAYAGYTISSALEARQQAVGRPAAGRERTFTVRALTVTPGTIAPVLSAFGEVRSTRALEVRAPVGGRVLDVGDSVEDGAPVQAGQLLFRIDPADAEAALALAQADMDRAQAELRDAERALGLAREDTAAVQAQFDLRTRALARRQDLATRGIATEAALEEAELAAASARQAVVGRRQAEAQAEARADQARNAVARQQITLDEATRRLRDTEVFAPFDGVLADVALVAGRIVNSNEQLARVVDPDALEVSVRLSTAQYLRLLEDDGQMRDTGAEIALQVAGVEVMSPGRVVRASATVEDGQSGRRVFVALDAPRGFRAGDFVTVRLQEPALENVAQIPASALTAAETVLVIGDDNRLTAQPVTLLRRQGDDVLIRAPHLTGREIVREVTPNLGTGILVRPMRDAEDGAPIVEEPQMVALDPDRRARLIAQVEGNSRIPQDVRARMLAQLEQDEVPAQVIERLENGGGGPRSGG